MRPLVPILLLAAIVPLAAAPRYSIQSVDTEIISGGQVVTLRLLLMVDSETGATWRYVARQEGGQTIEAWVPVKYLAPDSLPLTRPEDPPEPPPDK